MDNMGVKSPVDNFRWPVAIPICKSTGKMIKLHVANHVLASCVLKSNTSGEWSSCNGG